MAPPVLLCRRFGVEAVTTRELGGPESLNRTWLVTTPEGGRYLLKLHSDYDDLATIEARCAAIGGLAAEGLPVPAPRRAGAMFVVELAGRAVTMWGWLAGEPLAGRPQRAAHLQQAFASLHAGLHRVRRLPHVPATWGGRLKAVPSGHPVRRGIPDSQWFRLLDGFDEDVATLAAVPQTFVHGDLSPANVLSRRGGHSYIDWDLCQTGPVLLELAAHLLWRAPPAAVVRALLARAGLRPAEAGRQLAIVRPALRLITLRDVALAVTSPHLFGFARRRLARVATVDVSTDADRTKLM